MKTTIEKKRTKYFVFKKAAKNDPKNTPKITNEPKIFRIVNLTKNPIIPVSKNLFVTHKLGFRG